MLIEKLQACLSGELRGMGGGKYLYYPKKSPVILQMEAMGDGRLLIYCSFARNGSGLFLASFMTLLLTEDVPAVSPAACADRQTLGCVTGSVSQTYFRFLDRPVSRTNLQMMRDLAKSCHAFAEEMDLLCAQLSHDPLSSDDRLPSCNLADFRIAHLMENLDEA